MGYLTNARSGVFRPGLLKALSIGMLLTAGTAVGQGIEPPTPADPTRLGAGNLVSNGLFNTPVLSPDWRVEIAPGQRSSEATAILLNNQRQGAVATISQVVRGLVPGQSYEIGVEWRPGTEVETHIGPDSVVLELRIDGVAVEWLAPGGVPGWRVSRVAFTAGAAESVLSLSASVETPEQDIAVNWIGLFPADVPGTGLATLEEDKQLNEAMADLRDGADVEAALDVIARINPPVGTSVETPVFVVAPPAEGQPELCFARVTGDGLEWGGGTVWEEANVRALCKGTVDADARISCFTEQLSELFDWRLAIDRCLELDAPTAVASQTSVADEPAPAAAADASQADLCFERIMRDGLDYGGGTVWQEPNARAFCEGASDADARIACFTEQLPQRGDWMSAAQFCMQPDASQTAGVTPEPMPEPEQPAVADEPAPAAAADASQADLCFERIMRDGLDYGGGTVWQEPNARAFCEGASDADARIACFTEQLPQRGDWMSAAQFCMQPDASQTAGVTPEPMPEPEQPAVADEPAPAAAADASQADLCFERIMRDGLDYGGGTVWQEPNARAFCEGASDADARIACFTEQLPQRGDWMSAAQFCMQPDASQTAGVTPEPMPEPEQPAVADEPAPAAAADASQADLCFERIMRDGLDYGGGTVWQEPNARAFCEGASDADARIACFTEQLPQRGDWMSAAQFCMQPDASQTAGVTPEPMPEPEQPAVADEPAPAAAADASQADLCFERIMRDGLDYGGGTVWQEPNARAFCEGASDADARIACFTEQLPQRGDWMSAAQFCMHPDASGNAGVTPEPMQEAMPEPEQPAVADRPATDLPESSGQAITFGEPVYAGVQVWMMAYSIGDHVREDSPDDPNYYVGGLEGRPGITVNGAFHFDVGVIDGGDYVVLKVVGGGGLEGQYLTATADGVTYSHDLTDAAAFVPRAAFGTPDPNFVSLESTAFPGTFLRHQSFVLRRDAVTEDSPSLLRRDASFTFVPAAQ